MIVTSPILLTMRPGDKPVTEGAVAIHRGIILDTGIASKIISKFPSHPVLRIKNAVLMPGLINLHTHLELPPLLDEIRAQSFSDWVINLISAKKRFTHNDYIAATAVNIRKLIETGTTTVGEISTHGISHALLKKSGLRAIVFDEVISMSQDVANLFSFRIANRGLSGFVRSGISPHTPYTVSEQVLRQIFQLAKKKTLPLAMHIAESRDEIRLLQQRKSGLEKIYRLAHWDIDRAPKGKSSFEYLDRIGFLSRNLLAVHAVQVTSEDISLIKKTGVGVAHCPRSNKETRVGKMPLKKFLDAGISVGLGTDSLASSPNLNMWDEMRYAYEIHRRDDVSAEDIFRIATIGGATALGLDKEIGTLEPGKRADIIAIPFPSINTDDVYTDLLRDAKSSSMTMVNGRALPNDRNNCADHCYE